MKDIETLNTIRSASRAAYFLLMRALRQYADLLDEYVNSEIIHVKDDAVFAELMDVFLHVMKRAYKSGGLYVDRVVSKPLQSERRC